jgi:hypothetical protein
LNYWIYNSAWADQSDFFINRIGKTVLWSLWIRIREFWKMAKTTADQRLIFKLKTRSSIVDPVDFNADPDPGNQTNADPDPGKTLKSQKVEFLT